MSLPRLTLPLLLLALATSASAQDDTGLGTSAGALAQEFDQVFYKGLVGNVLDTIPMDPAGRLDLQRTNAVVSNTLFGRSLAILAGLSNPILVLGGFFWGVWAASSIKPADAAPIVVADPGRPGAGAAAQDHMFSLLERSVRVAEAPSTRVPAPVLSGSISAGNPDVVALSRPRVIKLWLPQRSPALSP